MVLAVVVALPSRLHFALVSQNTVSSLSSITLNDVNASLRHVYLSFGLAFNLQMRAHTCPTTTSKQLVLYKCALSFIQSDYTIEISLKNCINF